MKARDKQNIEKELRLSDEQKDKEKQQVDAWYDYCRTNAQSRIGKTMRDKELLNFEKSTVISL